MRKSLFLFGLFLLSSFLCHAAIVIQGDIGSDTTFYLSNNPHQIRGTVRVLNGANLVIEPGVNIFFEDNSQLIIEGSVQAVGTSLLPIVFSSISTETFNTRLVLTSAEASSFQYCTFGRTNDSYGLMRVLNSPNVSILHCSFGTSVAGNGVHIASSAVTINYSSFSSISGKGIYVSSNCTLNLHDSSFGNCQTALHIEDNAYPTLTLSNLSISDTSSYPLYMAARHYALLDGLSVSSAGNPYLYMWDTYIDSNTLLPNFALPYLLRSSLNINNGASLTLAEGVQIRFPQHAVLQVNNNSSLIALGTDEQPISFSPAGAFGWKNIIFGSNSRGEFSFCSFIGGGQQEYGYAEPTIKSSGAAELSFSNCDIAGGSTYAMYIEGSNSGMLELYNCLIHDAPNTGLYITNSSLNLDYANLSISDCGKPLMLPANLIEDLDNQPNLEDNTDNRIFIHMSGSIYRPSTFRNWGVPYVSESVEIYASYVPIQIEAGCSFQLGYSVGFTLEGALTINGTEEEPVVFDRLPGSTQNWRGFNLNSNCSSAIFNHCRLLNCSSSNQYNHVQSAISIYRADRVQLENVLIQNAICRGVYIESANSSSDSLDVQNLSIDGCGMDAFYQAASDYKLNINGLSINNCNAYPLSISANWAHMLSGLSLTNSAQNLIRFNNGGYLASQTLSNHGYPYLVMGAPLYVYYGVSVILEPGTTIYFDDALSLEIYGYLEANGSAAEPILFERKPGITTYWQGIRLYNNSNASFAYCIFNHGGRANEYGYNASLIDYRGASSTSFSDCQFLNTAAQAISITDSGTDDSFTVDNLQINGCGSDAVYINDTDPILSFTDLSIQACGRYPIDTPPKYASAFPNLSLVGNTNQYIRLSGGAYLYGNCSFPNYGYPYRQTVNIYGSSGSTVTIAAGCNFQIASGLLQEYSGNLIAQGNSEAPIIFTHIPLSSDYWMGIRVYNSSGSVLLSHCQILYAGMPDAYNNGYAFYNGGASSVSLENCLIRYSYRQGIRLESSSSSDVFALSNCILQDINGNAMVCPVPYHDFSVSNLSFIDISGYPLSSSADLLDCYSGLDIGSCSNPYIHVSSSYLSRSITWQDFGLPYLMSSEFTVQDWVCLSLAAGVELVFPDYTQYYMNSALNINGRLVCNGTADAPVLLRGLNPTLSSTWIGLRIINPEGVCTLNYTTLQNAGLDEQYAPPQDFCAMYISGGTVNLNNCTIQQGNHNLLKLDGNGTYTLTGCALSGGSNGIIHANGTLNLINNHISGCSGNGIVYYCGSLSFGNSIGGWNKFTANGLNIYNNTQSTLSAPYVYWGDTSAVAIDVLLYDNEEGKGKISFEPWLDDACEQLYYISLDAPQDVQISLLPNQQIRISWSPVYEATAYKLLAASSPDAETWSTLQQNITGNSVDININPMDAKLFYKVIAVK